MSPYLSGAILTSSFVLQSSISNYKTNILIDAALALKLSITSYTSDKASFLTVSSLVPYSTTTQVTTLLLQYALKNDLDLKLNITDYTTDKLTFLNINSLVPYSTTTQVNTLLLQYALKTDLDLKLDISSYATDKLTFLQSSSLIPYRLKID